MTVSTGAAGASDGVTSTTLLRTNFCSQACSRLRQSAREQARRHRRIPSAGRHALPAASPQVPRCRADALSRRPCRTRQPPDVLQSDWECASQLHRTRAPSDARCVCSSPLGRPRPFECGPSRADRRSGHCARSRRSLRPHFSIVALCISNIQKAVELTEYLRIYSCGQITLDPQNFGRKQKRSKLQSDLVVRIFHTRLRLNSKIFVPGQKKVSCGHSHDEIRLGN